ncbi:unnamed protein product [Lactuca virosa]|uniref:Uncharacterized protein n=1 Tax=Lactuca virosa TaxID=75947 RepID=A0AAU9P1D9_9ASTR|nr:unnamed protein product [Lactuca virosa]
MSMKCSINVEVAEEHVAPKSKFRFAFEEVELSDDEEEEDQEKHLIENEFEDFLQSISISKEDVVVTPSAVTERDCDSTVQLYSPTPEQMDALIADLQRTARKPPQTVPVTTEPPSESDQDDSAHVLLLRKRKRIDSRPGVLITDSVQNLSTPIESSFVAQNTENTFSESYPVMQEISSPLPESTLNIVFDLEHSSAEKDLIIGKQEIRINDLEKENSIKDAKISELQANLGGLTALFFDLKQCLHQKFGDDFKPLSAEGEKTSASSSGPTNSTSQPTSERVVRPSSDANLDTFLSSGPSPSQERRENKIRIE